MHVVGEAVQQDDRGAIRWPGLEICDFQHAGDDPFHCSFLQATAAFVKLRIGNFEPHPEVQELPGDALTRH